MASMFQLDTIVTQFKTTIDYQLIESLSILFQSTKYRTKRKILLNVWILIISIQSLCRIEAAIEKNYPHRLKIEFNDRKIFSLSNEEKNHKLSIISNDPNGLDRNNNDCLSICQCKWKSGKETANCDHRSLLSIPNGLSTTTQVIDLSGNVLTKLPPMVFVQRGLINLQRIYLADCQLSK